MPSSSSSSSSLDARSGGSSSGKSITGKISLLDKVVIALETFQASMDSVGLALLGVLMV